MENQINAAVAIDPRESAINGINSHAPEPEFNIPKVISHDVNGNASNIKINNTDFPPIKTNSEACKDLLVPLSVFASGASGLEAIAIYMKDVLQMRFCEIANAINRDDRTIWDAYSGAVRKNASFCKEMESQISVPISIFRERSLGVLEILSFYLKEELGMKYCRIARLLNKDDRTIWTSCRRARNKIKNARNN